MVDISEGALGVCGSSQSTLPLSVASDSEECSATTINEPLDGFRLKFRTVRDQREEISQLEAEIGNLTDTIASGLLRASSPALAQRLSKAEDELAKIRIAQTIKAPMLVIPDIEKRWLAKVDALDVMLTREPERVREEFRGILGRRIQVTPDESKRFLWASDYELGFLRTRAVCGSYGSGGPLRAL